jgi:CheY-like chemotaxis protein
VKKFTHKPTARPDPTDREPPPTPRILLVDDDVDYLAVTAAELEHAGFEVVTAEDGEQGFQRALEGRYDAAVLDVMMETPDAGFRLARRLRNDPRTRHIPLLLLSSLNDLNREQGRFTLSDRDRDDTWLPVDRFVEKSRPALPALRELLTRQAP